MTFLFRFDSDFNSSLLPLAEYSWDFINHVSNIAFRPLGPPFISLDSRWSHPVVTVESSREIKFSFDDVAFRVFVSRR